MSADWTADEVERYLIELVATRLDMDSIDIDATASVMRYGLDSLGVVELVTEVEEWVNLELPEHLLEGGLSIRNVVDEIVGRNGAGSNGSQPSARQLDRRPPTLRTGTSFHDRLAKLNARVDEAKAAGVYYYHPAVEPLDGAWVSINGRRMLMATSYSYLGLMGDARVREAACRAARTYGVGSHGSRLLAGTSEPHRSLEEGIASFFGVEDAMVFTSGFVANLSTISALYGKGDVIISDRFNHASISAGAAHSGARILTYAHNDVVDLEQCLAKVAGAATLVVADGVFSMSGTILPLPQITKLCAAYGAQLMVDEAHSFGVLGATGRGVVEYYGAGASLDIRMGTLSKAIPSMGGFICGSADLVSALRHNAEGYIFSGALPAVQVAAAHAGLNILRGEPERVEHLASISARVRDGLTDAGLQVLGDSTPIVPVVCDDVAAAFSMTEFCHDRGLFVLPVLYPAVPLDSPRLRLSLTADYTEDDADHVVTVVVEAAGAASDGR